MSSPAKPDRPRTYRAFGLAVQSAMALPELAESHHPGAPDIRLTLGEVTPSDRRPPALVEGVWAGPDMFVMEAPGVAAIEARRGAELVVEPRAGAVESDIRAFVLGSAIGALLHQRGDLPLHASAVVADGAAAAFVGPSGAGKSTLALALHDHGLPLLADDICVLRLPPEGEAYVSRGLVRMKLWRESLTATGRSPTDLAPVAGGLDKYQWPATALAGDADYPLRALYRIAEAGDGPEGIFRLKGVAAVRAIMDNTFRGQLVAPMGRAAEHWTQCLAVARRTPVFDFRRRRDLSALAEDAGRIAAHLGSFPGPDRGDGV